MVCCRDAVGNTHRRADVVAKNSKARAFYIIVNVAVVVARCTTRVHFTALFSNRTEEWILHPLRPEA